MLTSQMYVLYYQMVLVWELHILIKISPMGFAMVFLNGLFIIILNGG